MKLSNNISGFTLLFTFNYLRGAERFPSYFPIDSFSFYFGALGGL
jgi:hypothetical protein